mmetsp:Transcript_31272/g.103938  ORF Transcript_31272/g.103938 Transcript_31272/m.103938 type:complete len:111 (-) Transcript_31272:58-390(-)
MTAPLALQKFLVLLLALGCAAAEAENATAHGSEAGGKRFVAKGASVEQVSWLGRLGPIATSLLVLFITIGPAVALGVYRKMELRGGDEWGRSLGWKVDASDSGDDTDGLD